MERERMHLAEKALSVAPARGKVIRRGLENILNYTEYQYPRDFIETVAGLAQENYAFVIAANHTSHADAFPLAKVGSDVTRWINAFVSEEHQILGFMMPFALSMKNGGQGELLNFLFRDTKPILDRFKTEPVFTATENDIKSERVDKANTNEFLNTIRDGIKSGKGIVLFPEGKVEGGRLDEHGNLKGLQPFAEGALYIALRFSTMKKDKVAVIPVGISNGHKVYNPHSRRISKKAFLVGLGLSKDIIFSVKVGSPILYTRDEIREMDKDLIDKQIGAAIAGRLPHTEQGIYRGTF